jgi:hypothetical protein
VIEQVQEHFRSRGCGYQWFVFVAVDRDSGVGALVRVDPDSDGHELDAFLGDENRGGHS